MKHRARALLLPFAFLLAACGSDVEPYETRSTAVVSISALPYTPVGGLEIEEAWVSLDWILLVPCSDDEGSIGVGDFPVSLLHEPPPQAVFGTGLLTYCGVQLEAAPSYSQTPLDGLTALVRGTRTDGASVTIESRVLSSIKLVGASFDVSRVVLGFDLAVWLASVDVDGAELGDDGTVVINEENNAALLLEFEAGLASAPSLYTDLDRDGLVGEDELTPVATPE